MSDSNKGALTDLGLLVLRVVLGITFIIHGWGKIYSAGKFGMSEEFVKNLTDLQVPSPAVSAWLAAAAELGGGILVAAGFLPRIGALAIAGVMVVAILKVHLRNGFFLKTSGYEYCLNLLAMALAIVFAGGGKFSIAGMMGGKGKDEGGGGGEPKEE